MKFEMLKDKSSIIKVIGVGGGGGGGSGRDDARSVAGAIALPAAQTPWRCAQRANGGGVCVQP